MNESESKQSGLKSADDQAALAAGPTLPKAVALVVLGMHRSGTSALTRTLSLLGAALPGDLIEPAEGDNVTGFWESRRVALLNDEILQALGSSWNDVSALPPGWLSAPVIPGFRERARELLDEYFQGRSLFVIKDPRFCRLLPLWKEVLAEFGAETKFLHLLRNPLEVARSLNKRNGFGQTRSLLMWLRYNVDAEQATRGCSRVFLDYAGLLEDWQGTMNRVSQSLGLTWPRFSASARAEIEAFLSASLRHHRESDDSVVQRNGVPKLVKSLHGLLVGACRQGGEPDVARLDEIRQQLEESDAVFGVMVAEQKGELVTHRNVIKGLRRQQEEALQARELLQQANSRLAGQLEQLQEEVASLRQAQERLGGHLEGKQLQVERLERQQHDKDRRIAELQAQVEAAEQRLRELQQAMNDLQSSTRERLRALSAEAAGQQRSQQRRISEQLEKISRQLAFANQKQQGLGRNLERILTRLEQRSQSRAGHLVGWLGERLVRATARAHFQVDAKLRFAGDMARLALRPESSPLRLWSDFLLLKRSGLFDYRYYLDHYPEVARQKINPILHYLERGAADGKNPSRHFDTNYYLEHYPEVAQAGSNPLVHYLREGRRRGLEKGEVTALAATVKPAANPDARLTYASYASRPFKKHSAFAEYLCASIADPFILQHPYSQEETYLLDYMDYLKEVLRQRYREAPQDDLVSVIMPAFNRSSIITRAIESVRAQSYKNWELLVVDDCSQDDTAAVAGAIDDERIKVFSLEANSGAAGARNYGIRQAQGKYVAFLDSDDVWDPDFLLIMVNELRRHPGLRFAYSALRTWWEKDFEPGSNSRNFRRIHFGMFNRALLENHNYLSIISVLLERSLLEHYRGFAEDLKRMEDHELFLRLTEREGVLPVPIPLADYIVEPQRRQASLAHRGSADFALATMRRNLQRNCQVEPELLHVEVGQDLYGVAGPVAKRDSGTVSVIIPSFECLDYLKSCVNSLKRYTRDFELVIVDNASSDTVIDYLKELGREGHRLIFNDWNAGFSYAVNQALECIPRDHDVVVLNNDVIVTPGWLDALAQAAYHDDSIGMAAPRQVLLAGDPEVKRHVPFASSDFEMDINLSLVHRNVIDPLYDPQAGLVELNFAPFCCVFIRKDVLAEVRLLDHVAGFHYGSDSSFCSLVRHQLKRRIVYTNRSKIYHFHRQAARYLKATNQELHRALFAVNRFDDIATRFGGPVAGGRGGGSN